MAMHSLTNLDQPGIRASFKYRRVSIGVTNGGSCGPHSRVEQECLESEVVTNKPNEYGVPKDSGWARQCVEHLAGNMGLPILAKPA